MPGFDGTGPRGQGPLSGGGRGYCAVPVGTGTERFAYGFGGGRGRGNRYRLYATGVPGCMRGGRGMGFGQAGNRPEPDKERLKQQEEFLKQQLEAVQASIAAMDKKETE